MTVLIAHPPSGAAEVLRAIYRDLDAPDGVWLDGIRGAALRAFRLSEGTVVGEISVDANLRVDVSSLAGDATASAIHRALLEEASVRIQSTARAPAPEGADSSRDHSLAGMMGTFLRLMPPPVVRSLLLSGPASRFSRALPPAWVLDLTRDQEFADCSNAIGLDPSGRGLVLSIPSKRGRHAPRLSALAKIAGHLAAVHRLRRRAGPVEAVVDRERVVHAEGDARDRRAREALRAAALRVDRADSARWTEPALWTALVDGRWSLVERFDSDGRRLLVARRNEPPHGSDRRLDEDERKVVALLALGRAQKCIAYELGIAESAVSAKLRCALRKLGVRNRSELIELRGALTPAEDER